MIHIIQNSKSKKYDVVVTGINGEYLSGTKQGFDRKSDVWKNLFAQMGQFDSSQIYVQTDTPKPKIHKLYIGEHGEKKREENDFVTLVPPYTPKKKKA